MSDTAYDRIEQLVAATANLPGLSIARLASGWHEVSSISLPTTRYRILRQRAFSRAFDLVEQQGLLILWDQAADSMRSALTTAGENAQAELGPGHEGLVDAMLRDARSAAQNAVIAELAGPKLDELSYAVLRAPLESVAFVRRRPLPMEDLMTEALGSADGETFARLAGGWHGLATDDMPDEEFVQKRNLADTRARKIALEGGVGEEIDGVIELLRDALVDLMSSNSTIGQAFGSTLAEVERDAELVLASYAMALVLDDEITGVDRALLAQPALQALGHQLEQLRTAGVTL